MITTEDTEEKPDCQKADRAQERSDQTVIKPNAAAIGEASPEEELPIPSVHYHESGEIFAEDVDQHMRSCRKL